MKISNSGPAKMERKAKKQAPMCERGPGGGCFVPQTGVCRNFSAAAGGFSR